MQFSSCLSLSATHSPDLPTHLSFLSSCLAFLGLSDCSCYRWGVCRGFLSVCLMRRWWKMRQGAAIYQHLRGTWRHSGQREGRFFCMRPGMMKCMRFPLHCVRQTGGRINKEKEKGEGPFLCLQKPFFYSPRHCCSRCPSKQIHKIHFLYPHSLLLDIQFVCFPGNRWQASNKKWI